jgi:aspartate-semialdehyde dehydrogenase
LVEHPWFDLAALGASERSAGRPYGEAVRWKLAGEPPFDARDMNVRRCDADLFADCDLVFSGLDRAPGRELEPRFAAAGLAVVSNSAAHRMEPDVPLVVPEINADHLELLGRQRQRFGGGFIVTNPNCSVIGLALGLAPLHRSFGVERVVVTTLQAISGAGIAGPTALDLVDNVLPHVPGEEEKLERELQKILGSLGPGGPTPAKITVSAHCHRVSTIDGHLEAVSVGLARPATPEQVAAALEEFRGDALDGDLPSAPRPPIQVRREPDRPQPRLDRAAGGGMALVVGRIRPCPVLGVKLELLSHNTVRGAAGGTVLLAELLVARGWLERRAPV